jgi:hypothetical protein
MRFLRSPWGELAFAALLGIASGLAYRFHRAAADSWSAAHDRLDERVGLPASSAIPFRQRWSADEAGRLRTWPADMNEERVEVFPTPRVR